MCIANAVGRGCVNARDDVRTVQLLLNLSLPHVVGPLVADGVCGAVTITAIEQFQRGLIGGTDALGVVTPGGTGSTLHALQSAMPVGFSVEKLEGIMVHASAAAVARYFTGIVEGMAAGD